MIGKNRPMCGKRSQNSGQTKNCKNIYTKVENTYIKPLFKPLSTFNDPCFENFLKKGMFSILSSFEPVWQVSNQRVVLRLISMLRGEK